MPTPRRAVLTGLGILSPIGTGVAAFRAGLAGGTAGVRGITHFDPSGLPFRIAGEIPNFDAKKLIASKDMKKSLNKMARTVQLGLCASQLCMDDGGPPAGTYDPFRFGVEFGCVMVATEVDDLARGGKVSSNCAPGAVDLTKWGRDGLALVPPIWMLKYLPNMPACHTSIYFNAQGPNNTITASDAASVLALGEAYRIMGRGLADYFLVGGCESKINPVSFTRHNKFSTFTPRNETPATAVRPFDANRDGEALGEAACVVGLEELECATKRGAKVYAELVGFASGFDKGKKGPVLAGVIRNALREANIRPEDVDHVNAHAHGSPALDAFEARAIAEVFGADVPVFALAGQTGNSGAASGLTELAVSVLALHGGELPGTVNHAKVGADCPIRVHVGSPRPVSRKYAVKTSYTDLGQCTAVVVKKWEGA